MSRRSRANVLTVAGLTAVALVAVGAGGGAVAAVTIGSKQIADNSIRSRDVRDGTLQPQDLGADMQAALRGATGPQGPPGTAGPAGAPGPAAVVATFTLSGPVASIVANSGDYVFAGPSAYVTTTPTSSRVTASASAPMGLNSGTPQLADVGVCFQPAAGGVLMNFYGSSFSQHYFTTTRATYAVAATKVLPVGTFNVGMCVRNNGGSTINNNNYVNGWVMVTS
jgi:hypothetical protein